MATMEKRVMTVSKRRRGLTVASALLGGVLVLSACSGGGSDDPKNLASSCETCNRGKGQS